MLTSYGRLFLFFFSFILASPIIEAQTQTEADSLLLELNKPMHDTIKFEILLKVGDVYEYNQPDIAKDYYIRAKQLAESNIEQHNNPERKFQQQKAKAIRYIAYVYQNQGDLNTALSLYFEALAIGEAIGCNLNIYNSYNNIGIINHIQKQYDVARDYYNKAIDITERTGNRVGRAKLYINMGILNYELGGQTDSLDLKQKLFNQALENYSNALAIKIEVNDLKGQSLCYENLGNLNKEIASITEIAQQKRAILAKAGAYYRNAMALSKKINDKNGLSKVYANLSELFCIRYTIGGISQPEKAAYIDSAVHYGTQSYRLATELNSQYLQNRTALLIKNTYTTLQNYEQALKYANIFIETQDKLFTDEKAKALNELRVKYESEKKDDEIKMLNNEKELKEAEVQNAKRERLLYIILTLSFFLLSTLLYRLYVTRKRSSKMLETKNEELAVLNSTKDKFISILAHDLKNPFAAFYNIASSLSTGYDNISDSDKRQLINHLSQSAENVSNLLKNMLEWAYSQQRAGHFPIEPINLYSISQGTIDNLSSLVNERNILIINNIPNKIEASANQSALESILSNLITNAVKFSNPNSVVEINANQHNGYVRVHVKDQGIGLSPTDISKLFRIDVDTRTIGGGNGKGTGLGLIICKELVTRMGGEISVTSTKGEGSVFTIALPSQAS